MDGDGLLEACSENRSCHPRLLECSSMNISSLIDRRGILTVVASLLLSSVAAAQEPAPVPDLTGSWSGHWESCKNGHHGPLSARFCKTDDGHYEVVFRGRFFKVVPFRYATTLTVTGYDGDRVLLSASKRLGPVLGSFSMDADATSSDFTAHFSSRDDQGLFVLRRTTP
jgi:hypothetical protein